MRCSALHCNLLEVWSSRFVLLACTALDTSVVEETCLLLLLGSTDKKLHPAVLRRSKSFSSAGGSCRSVSEDGAKSKKTLWWCGFLFDRCPRVVLDVLPGCFLFLMMYCCFRDVYACRSAFSHSSVVSGTEAEPLWHCQGLQRRGFGTFRAEGKRGVTAIQR